MTLRWSVLIVMCLLGQAVVHAVDDLPRASRAKAPVLAAGPAPAPAFPPARPPVPPAAPVEASEVEADVHPVDAPLVRQRISAKYVPYRASLTVP